MARQSTTPVQFPMQKRIDNSVIMTSGFAGKCVMVDFAPVLRGDSVSGRFGIDIDLAEMPRPLLNAVTANVQAWFVPKSAFPQFSGYDEFMHSYEEEQITALGQADRTPPPFFTETIWPSNATQWATVKDSEMFKTMGLHVAKKLNCDLIDAYNLVYNFRLAAHSKELTRREYASENLANSVKFAPAFWPSGRFSKVVPDYERALVVGALDLDVSAGQLPISGIAMTDGVNYTGPSGNANETSNPNNPITYGEWGGGDNLLVDMAGDVPNVFAEMAGQKMTTTLADIDKARETQAFAKIRSAMTGNDPTGFVNDDVIVSQLMQGFTVPAEQFKRPWLLDAKRVTFGMAERHATDAANLDQSVSKGRASAVLSINVPRQDVGGYIIMTVEVLPERIFEAQEDYSIRATHPSNYPNALRDTQRIEPVDTVVNSRIDARHTAPDAAYGYEPMNDRWNRDFTRLGGTFYQADPANPWTEQRSAIWQAGIVDPVFGSDHYIAPADFPQYVFADEEAPAFELVARHSLSITGLTQIGDTLVENSDDYAAVTD